MGGRRKAPGERLKDFIDANGVSVSEAARQLGVSHPALYGWFDGSRNPEAIQRLAIERWTDGAIESSEWETKEERDRRRAVEAIEPFKPTGTHGKG